MNFKQHKHGNLGRGAAFIGSFCALALAALGSAAIVGHAAADPAPTGPMAARVVPAALPMGADATPADRKAMLTRFCSGCHNDKLKVAGWSVTPLDPTNLAANDATWEKILRRLSLGEMPPKGMPRPAKANIDDFTHWLAASLDANAAANPDPGHATLRRMNRAEYAK